MNARRRLAVFVAGTDTGVGKSVVAAALLRCARAAGLSVAAMKPIASGAALTPQGWRNEDALQLIEAMGGDATDARLYATVNPYCFAPAISAHLAAREAGVRIDVASLRELARQLSTAHELLVVEGAGGWFAPIDDAGASMADLAIAFGMPVLLVVGLRLGCLSHAELTLRAIRSSGLPFAGWIGNALDPGFERLEQNLDTLARRLGSAPLALLPYQNDPMARRQPPPWSIEPLIDALAPAGIRS